MYILQYIWSPTFFLIHTEGTGVNSRGLLKKPYFSSSRSDVHARCAGVGWREDEKETHQFEKPKVHDDHSLCLVLGFKT